MSPDILLLQAYLEQAKSAPVMEMASCVWNAEWNPSNFSVLLNCVGCLKCSLDGGQSEEWGGDAVFLKMRHCLFKKRTPGKKQLLKLTSPDRYSAEVWPGWSGVKAKTEGISVACDPDSTAGPGNPKKTSYHGLRNSWWNPCPLFQTDVNLFPLLHSNQPAFPCNFLALCFTLL